MKSAIAAFVSVVLGVLVGYAAFVFFAPRGYAGRDVTPLMAFAALFLIGSGVVYGRWWLAGGLACAAGLAAYALVVGALVTYFSGASPANGFFLDWFFLVLAVTLVPWGLGVFAGKWARRIQFTP